MVFGLVSGMWRETLGLDNERLSVTVGSAKRWRVVVDKLYQRHLWKILTPILRCSLNLAYIFRVAWEIAFSDMPWIKLWEDGSWWATNFNVWVEARRQFDSTLFINSAWSLQLIRAPQSLIRAVFRNSDYERVTILFVVIKGAFMMQILLAGYNHQRVMLRILSVHPWGQRSPANLLS